ncbi:MAG: PhoH family protein [Candidatus Cloacimonetes bacterium]|nr:PhoH family protein [Candidatus Cloacimonadota bacterium]MBS3768067.1 PhoH family protein [Candidatus Cloacimonadota bacterium]
MKKIFVLDTNVLIHDPNAVYNFEKNQIVIPITVIEEIDSLKKGMDEKGRNARFISRLLDKLRKKNSLSKGVKTKTGGTLKVSLSHKVSEDLNNDLITDKNDNLIIGTALHLQIENPNTEVILVSKDANVRIKADTLGIKAENYEHEKVNFEELYTGILKHETSKKELQNLREELEIKNTFGLQYYNQFLLMYEKDNFGNNIVARYDKDENTVQVIEDYTKNRVWGIRALNPEQEASFEILLDDDIKIVSLLGMAGTGKTLLALAAGLRKVIEEEKYSRLIVTRPIFPLGKDIGYLPGTKEEKYDPWMQPIYDNMEILLHTKEQQKNLGKKTSSSKPNTTMDDYLDFGFIQMEPLTYIRGRSLPDQYLIVDEAQNLTPHEMKTILTRAGDDTKVVLTGDPYQIDIPYLDSESNGLSIVAEKFKDEQLAGHVTLVKGERSLLAAIAAKYL